MDKRLFISTLLLASLALWCGCGGPQDPAVDGGTPVAADGADGSHTPQADRQPGGDKTSPADAHKGTDPKPGDTPSGGGAKPVDGKLDTSYISDDFVAAAVLRPGQIVQSKLVATVRGLPSMLTQGAMPMEVGMMLDPNGPGQDMAQSVEQVIGLAAPSDAMPFIAPAVIVRCKDAQAAEQIVGKIKAEGEQRTHNGKTYYFQSTHVTEHARVEVPTEAAAETLAQFQTLYGEPEEPPPGFDNAGETTVKPEITSTKSADGKTTTIVVKSTREAAPGEPNAAYLPDEKTVVISVEPLLKKMIDAKGVKSPLIDRLTALDAKHDLAVVVLTERLKPAIAMGKQAVEGDVPPFAIGLFTALDAVEAATITAGLDADPMLSIVLETGDEAGAQSIDEQAGSLLQMGRGTYNAATKQMVQERPEFQPLFDFTGGFVNGVALKREGTQVVATAPGLKDLDQLPEKLKPLLVIAANLERKKRIRDISVAILNHQDQRGDLPINLAGEDGKPLLSWRVALLPYLEERFLYEEFELTEAWDGEHNKQLLELMPEVLAPVDGAAKPGHTVYLMFQGKGTLLDGQPKSFASIADGTSNTISVIEVSPERAVPWTRPIDIDLEAADLKQALGPPPTKEGYTVVYFDGHVGVIPSTMDIEEFKRLIRINDGG
jgi:hypothetical protein